jgi:hypothetical protein
MKTLLFILFVCTFYTLSYTQLASWPLITDGNGTGGPGITAHPMVLGAGISHDAWFATPRCNTSTGCTGRRTTGWTSTTTSLTKTASGGAYLGNRYVEFSFSVNAGASAVSVTDFQFSASGGYMSSSCSGAPSFAIYRSTDGTNYNFTGTTSGCAVNWSSINSSNNGACETYSVATRSSTCYAYFPFTVNPGGRVWFRIYIGSTYTSDWRAIFGNVSFSGSNPLAVSLNSFNATCESNGTDVTWTTASEKNASHFDLERSRDGQNWEIVKTVQASGNSTTLKTYGVHDPVFYSSTGYYRLKQVDFDGTEEIHGPIAVNCAASDNSLLVFPNPSNGEFGVEIHSSEVLENASVVVYDNTGKQLLRSELNNTLKGTNMVYFSDSKLAAGSYLVVLESETKHTLKPVKLVIQ